MNRFARFLQNLLVAHACLAYLTVMIDGYPLRGLNDIPDVNYNIGFEESLVTFANKPLLWLKKKIVDDYMTEIEPKPSLHESDVHILKKKNSEIISALMGLRRAMSNNYGERYVPARNIFKNI